MTPIEAIKYLDDLKKNTIYNSFFILILLLLSEGVWVKYGWELYHYVVDAQIASHGVTVTAYNTNSIHSSLSIHLLYHPIKISQSLINHFSGMVNNDLFGIN